MSRTEFLGGPSSQQVLDILASRGANFHRGDDGVRYEVGQPVPYAPEKIVRGDGTAYPFSYIRSVTHTHSKLRDTFTNGVRVEVLHIPYDELDELLDDLPPLS